jgi:predicted secreted hydrolase
MKILGLGVALASLAPLALAVPRMPTGAAPPATLRSASGSVADSRFRAGVGRAAGCAWGLAGASDKARAGGAPGSIGSEAASGGGGVPGVARTAGGFENADRSYAFSFPRDHAAHYAYQSEWWYYTGHVTAADGRRFGYELTFFRIGLRPGDPKPERGRSKWRGNQVYAAHFALTDERGEQFVHYERLAREALGAGSSSAKTLDVHVGDWALAGTQPFRMRAAADRDAISFAQFPEKPPAVHGHDGISLKAGCATCASHYYSMTRLRTVGTLAVGGKPLRVAGISWMDHEFGSAELQSNQAGWDWFSIQLNDRRELMLYRLRQKDGSVTPQSSGSLVDPQGHVTYLPLGDFSTEATGTWKSPHTSARYPSGWRVHVPAADIDLELRPVLDDQELSNPGGISYWEGAVDVIDPATRRPIGVGYVELTGYAGSIAL